MFIDKKKKNLAGFSLLEVLLTISIMIIVVDLTVPRVVYFYKNQQSKEQIKQLAQTIRLAQALAWSGWQDKSYGVYLDFDNFQYALYQGESYANRQTVWGEAGSLTYLSQATSTFSQSDIRFTKNSLQPVEAGTISLVADDNSFQIFVNEIGLVKIE